MTVTVRPARSGDGAGISRAWLSAATYYADLDPEHFQVPRAEGLAESWDNQFVQQDDDLLQLVAELDGQVVGWLWARIEPPGPNAAAQLAREHGWTRLVVTSLIVDRGHWRGGAGTALLEKAEAWGAPRVPRLPAWTPTRTARSRCPSTKITWATSAARSYSRNGSDHLIRSLVSDPDDTDADLLGPDAGMGPTALAARGAVVRIGSGWTDMPDRSSVYDATRR